MLHWYNFVGMIKACVILAAGKNSRLDTGKPKSLLEVNGISLLERHIKNFSALGVEQFCIITGHNPDPIRQIVPDLAAKYKVCIEAVHNEKYDLENGYSVSTAEKWLIQKQECEFFLTMGDHIFQYEFLTEFVNADFEKNRLCLAVDVPSATNKHIDLEDVTKVLIDDYGRIRHIGKQIQEYNRYDTGLFYMNNEVFPVLKDCFEKSKYTISDMVNALVNSEDASTITIGGYNWNDVDNLLDLEATKKLGL